MGLLIYEVLERSLHSAPEIPYPMTEPWGLPAFSFQLLSKKGRCQQPCEWQRVGCLYVQDPDDPILQGGGCQRHDYAGAGDLQH